jgi:ribosomal protein S18 acetylase RimI-like enzyme
MSAVESLTFRVESGPGRYYTALTQSVITAVAATGIKVGRAASSFGSASAMSDYFARGSDLYKLARAVEKSRYQSVGYIDNVEVPWEYRGRGFAQALTAFTVNEMFRAGAEVIYLWVLPSDDDPENYMGDNVESAVARLARLYGRIGFTRYATASGRGAASSGEYVMQLKRGR